MTGPNRGGTKGAHRLASTPLSVLVTAAGAGASASQKRASAGKTASRKRVGVGGGRVVEHPSCTDTPPDCHLGIVFAWLIRGRQVPSTKCRVKATAGDGAVDGTSETIYNFSRRVVRRSKLRYPVLLKGNRAAEIGP